jgi:poly(3-hydroxybutyrate) depolymerase
MGHRFRTFLATAFACAAASSGPLALGQAPPPAQSVSDAELARVVAALVGVREARLTGGDGDAALVALDAALAALRLGGKDGQRGVDLLARPTDLGRALTLAERHGQPTGARAPKAGKVEEERLTGGSFTARAVDFVYRMPKADQTMVRGFPMILSLPDLGERPAEHLRERWASRAALEGFIVVVPALPRDPADPQDSSAWTKVAAAGRPGGVAHALAVLRFARERLPVDPDRVFLAGLGASGHAALATADYGPHLFAGVAVRALEENAVSAQNFRNLPTLLIGGGPAAERFAAGNAEKGYDNCTREATLTEESALAWFEARRRDASPTTISFVVGTPYPTRVGWLRVAPNAVDTAVRAAVDRGANTVRVLATGASSVTLHLGDALLDLDEPVQVDFEGRVHAVRVRRSAALLVERWLDGTSDPGAPYVAELVLAPGTGVVGANEAQPEEDEELDERLADATRAAVSAEDADPLWEVALWCLATDRDARVHEVAAKALRIDPNHAAARNALGHVRAPVGASVEWFSHAAARDRWLARQRPETAEALGHVQHAGLWMHPRDRERASRGWRKDAESGLWRTPEDERRVRQGWSRQDLVWLDPSDTARADTGLWRVGGEWLPLAAANRRHAELAHAWRIPRWHAELWTTVDRAVAERALVAMEATLPALQRVFGSEPELPLRVALLRDEEQYDRFAFGDPDGRRAAVHTGRLHTVHSAFFAESWFPQENGKKTFMGMGAGYWDSLGPNGDAYGLHAARLAFALSYVDALDPSPRTVAKALPKGPAADHFALYEAEKSLPRWLRLGGAVYAERYFRDVAAEAGGGDPWWARTWSLENLAQRGGLGQLDEALRAELDPDDRLGALRRMLAAGAVVAFIVDGGCAPVEAAHVTLLTGLRAGRVRPEDTRALEAALHAHEPALRAFVGE